MDGSLNTVVHFKVKLGKLVFLVRGRFLDVSERTSIDNVPDNETLNGLILGDSLACGHTAHTVDVSATVLVSSVVASLDSHDILATREGKRRGNAV
jgi:hypothetical protein